MTPNQLRWLKRRQANEPVIGHLKAEHRMQRNHGKGCLGDAPDVVGVSAGHDPRWQMQWGLVDPFLRATPERSGAKSAGVAADRALAGRSSRLGPTPASSPWLIAC